MCDYFYDGIIIKTTLIIRYFAGLKTIVVCLVGCPK